MESVISTKSLSLTLGLREGKERLQKKKVKFGLLAEPLLTTPPPTIGVRYQVIFFYCFTQIYALQNMKQLYGVLSTHLI